MPLDSIRSQENCGERKSLQAIDYCAVSLPPNAKGRPWQDAQADPQILQV